MRLWVLFEKELPFVVRVEYFLFAKPVEGRVVPSGDPSSVPRHPETPVHDGRSLRRTSLALHCLPTVGPRARLCVMGRLSKARRAVCWETDQNVFFLVDFRWPITHLSGQVSLHRPCFRFLRRRWLGAPDVRLAGGSGWVGAVP